ncbi:MAG: class I SAM-dependent methyltransferase [Saccharofermentanales bacterium]
MDSYATLSAIYDRWQEDSDTAGWADHIDRIITANCRITKGDGADDRLLLLDLGCGTGGFAIEMARRGYDVLGIDQSYEMLSIAKMKDVRESVQFIQQDITAMELFGTVDIIVCLLDTVNHILSEPKLDRMFRLCKNYLNPGGLLIFDAATPCYFENILGDNVFYDIKDQYTLIWQNHIDKRRRISSAELTLFFKQDDLTYIRSEDYIEERIYAIEKIESLIHSNGMKVVKEYGGLTFRKPSPSASRVFFVAENRNDEHKKRLKMIAAENS